VGDISKKVIAISFALPEMQSMLFLFDRTINVEVFLGI